MKVIAVLIGLAVLVGCKHPLEIQGHGDIVERNNGIRGCSLEEYQAKSARCTSNTVDDEYEVIYEAVPRAGWKFVGWDTKCADDSPGDYCKFSTPGDWVALWNEHYTDTPVPPVKAVFEQVDSGPVTTTYLGSSFGIDGYYYPFSSFMRADMSGNSTYQYKTLLESTRNVYDRGMGHIRRAQDGLVSLGATSSDYSAGGAATSNMDFMALVDTNASDGEISVTYLTQELTGASNSLLSGTYYCGSISTDPSASFAKAQFDGRGGGTLTVQDHTLGYTGTTPLKYQIASDGRTQISYQNIRLVGSVSGDGQVMVGTQTQSFAQGSGICIKTSSGKSLGNVAGDYYGVYASTYPSTAVAELSLSSNGSAQGWIVADSFGNRSVPVRVDPVRVSSDGKLSSGRTSGMVSKDGRIGFIVDAGYFGEPSLIVYVRKTP
jgi:hypothetical protein